MVKLIIKSKYYYICHIMLLKKLNDAADVNTSNLAAKRDFIILKAEVYKLEML